MITNRRCSGRYHRGILRFSAALLLPLALVLSAAAASAKSADEAIQAEYGIAWEQLPAAPSPNKRVPPRYSRSVRQLRGPEVVKAVFRIDAGGRVEGLRCYSDSNSQLASESHAALVRWRFPKQAGGPYRLMLTVRPAGEPGGVSIGFE